MLSKRTIWNPFHALELNILDMESFLEIWDRWRFYKEQLTRWTKIRSNMYVTTKPLVRYIKSSRKLIGNLSINMRCFNYVITQWEKSKSFLQKALYLLSNFQVQWRASWIFQGFSMIQGEKSGHWTTSSQVCKANFFQQQCFTYVACLIKNIKRPLSLVFTS